MVLDYVSRRGTAAELLVAIVCGGLFTGLCTARAQTTPQLGESSLQLAQAMAPFGAPETAPLSNPFPVTPETTTPPNFRYESNLQPQMGLVPEAGFHVVPRISLGEEFNDNIFQTENNRRWDLITLIAPGIAVSNNSPRLRLSLNYSPVARIYARTSSLDFLGHQLLGVANAVVIPDEFYVNARAFANDVPSNGGFIGGTGFGLPNIVSPSFGSTPLGVNKNNLSQVEAASVTPYLIHRFGSFGTGKIGLNLSQVYSSRTSGLLIGSPNGPALHGYTGEAIAQFLSGDDWGRIVDIATLDAEKTTGTGVLSNSTRAVADNRLGYVLKSWLLVFGEFGAESIQYRSTTPRISINDGIWGLGATVLPNVDSSITLSYGHREGVTSWQAQGRYAVTARTVVTASYVAGLTTDLQDISSRLQGVGVNPLGNPVNVDTGAPISLVNALAGINNTIYKNRQLTITATTLLDRNTISLSFRRQNEEPIASTAPQVLVNNTTTYGTATWVHEVNLRTTLTSSLSYGVRTVSSENEKFLGASAQLGHRFTDQLTGNAIYSFYDRRSNVPGVSMYENIVLLSITRTF